MKAHAVMNLVDTLHAERNIPREVIFSSLESALLLAAQKHFGADKVEDPEEISVRIDRNTGEISAYRAGLPVQPDLLGRIAAQAAKQLFIQKLREAECQAVFDEFTAQKGDLVKGTITRLEQGGAAIVNLGKTEALLPKSEQIPGETFHQSDRVEAVITEVRKNGHRVKIILSRTHPDFVRQLFEREIPEIADRTIEIKAIAREAGYRTKVAVSSIDSKVDCVGACVGVRGSRIRNVVDVLGGERIDIVRWNDALQVLIPNALQPAEIEEVGLYPRLERAIVLVREDQLSLAIGRRGQNVRLASKLVGWHIEIMTHEELNRSIERAEVWFNQLPHTAPEVVDAFIEEGFLSYDDLTYLAPEDIVEMTGLTEEQAQDIIDFAERMSAELGEDVREKRLGEQDKGGRSTALARAEQKLFGETPAPVAESRPTASSLFGDNPIVSREEPPAEITAEQLFATPPATEETAPAEEMPPASTAETSTEPTAVSPASAEAATDMAGEVPPELAPEEPAQAP